jgi:putative ubiquitin-RnfH superfamily antitoxin RatB of RatAB toxin-antitoxin module
VTRSALIRVSVAYALPKRQIWLKFNMPEGATAAEAIARSGILQQCPEIDVEHARIGIFGRIIKKDQVLSEGDRIEIYRPLKISPDKKKAKTGS